MFRAALLALALSADLPAVPQSRNLAVEYLALVERFRDGDVKPAVDALATWPARDLQQVLDDLPRRLRALWQAELERQDASPAAPFHVRPTPLELLATAATAHLHAARAVDDLPAVETHIQFASSLIDLPQRLERAGQPVTVLAGDPSESQEARIAQGPALAARHGAFAAFAARAHLAAGTIQFGFLQVDRAQAHFETAQRLRPEDPLVLLALGSVHETLAALSEAARLVVPARRRPGQPPRPTRQQHLDEGRRLFEATLALDSTLVEARLRLARTLQLLKRPDEAADQMTRVPASVSEPYLRYLTYLVTGAIEESRGRDEDAGARYRDARDLCRDCQSANLAISHVLRRSGKVEDARVLVEGMLAAAAQPLRVSDPWWTYNRGQWVWIDAMLEDLRRRVPR